MKNMFQAKLVRVIKKECHFRWMCMYMYLYLGIYINAYEYTHTHICAFLEK